MWTVSEVLALASASIGSGGLTAIGVTLYRQGSRAAENRAMLQEVDRKINYLADAEKARLEGVQAQLDRRMRPFEDFLLGLARDGYASHVNK